MAEKRALTIDSGHSAQIDDGDVLLVAYGIRGTTASGLRILAPADSAQAIRVMNYADTQAALTIDTSNLRVGFGAITTPSAVAHLPAGTATAAPIRLTSGVALGTEQDGAIEYHGSHLYFTIGATRHQLDQQLVAFGGVITPEGGLAVPMVNDTGAPSVKGMLVQASPNVDGGFIQSVITAGPPVGQYEVTGAVYEAGVANGSPCYVVVCGLVDVLMEDGQAATRSYWVRGSTAVAGRASMLSTPPSVTTTHFQEIGHSMQSAAAGTDVLARILMHFN